jgi:hypothetical protein
VPAARFISSLSNPLPNDNIAEGEGSIPDIIIFVLDVGRKRREHKKTGARNERTRNAAKTHKFISRFVVSSSNIRCSRYSVRYRTYPPGRDTTAEGRMFLPDGAVNWEV